MKFTHTHGSQPMQVSFGATFEKAELAKAFKNATPAQKQLFFDLDFEPDWEPGGRPISDLLTVAAEVAKLIEGDEPDHITADGSNEPQA